jgi:hypothetical protein
MCVSGYQKQSKLILDVKSRLLPVQVQFAMRGCAVPQIQVDEALVRNAHFLRNGLEVADGLFVEPNRDLLFELGCVGIFPGS